MLKVTERTVARPERVDWVLELFAFGVAIGAIVYISRNSPILESGEIHIVKPIVSAVMIGSSLGLYQKLALSKTVVGPRFPTTYLFFVCLSLVVLTPLLKYPMIAEDVRAASTDDTKISGYYEGRGLAIGFFFVNSVLLTTFLYTYVFAIQQTRIRQSLINMSVSILPPVFCILFDEALLGE